MSHEVNSIIQRVIPILLNSCDIPRKNILTDSSTALTTPKRGDIWISNSEIEHEKKFEKDIILLIEVKDESTKPIPFEKMYVDYNKNDFSLNSDFEQALKKDYNAYSAGDTYSSEFKGNKWFDAIIQAKYKSEKQGLKFFAVTNCNKIIFYHTKDLKPIVIVKGKDNIIVDFWIKKSLIEELYSKISSSTNLLEIKKVEGVIDNPSEYEFQKFLNKIHNQNVFRFNEEIIIETLLTFVFFKFLEEKIITNGDAIPSDVILWSDFTKGSTKGKEGKTIIENMYQQLNLLKEEKLSKYKAAYKEFTPILKVDDELLKDEENHPVIYEIWKEFSRYNFHGCKFDIYGGIYEEFANPKQKEKLGQYYTRRHISKTLAYLTLRSVKDIKKDTKICDPACGTGGLITECFSVIKDNLIKEYNSLPAQKEKQLSNDVFYAFDIRRENVEKAKLNMFFAGEGHTHIDEADSIKSLPHIIEQDDTLGYDTIIANPPYGNGSEWYKGYVSWMNSKRHELVFIEKMIKALRYGGKFGFVVPDGVLENPRWQEFRERLIEQVKIESIISVPVHAFAPYCMQKTYLIIGERRSYDKIIKISNDTQLDKEAKDIDTIKKEKIDDLNEKIWFYIIDFDGFANSNKRFPTNLSRVNDKNEIEFIHNDLFELKEKYLTGDDGQGNIQKINQVDINGDVIGESKSGKFILKKSGYATLNKEISRKNWFCLLPENYLRPYEPKHISLDEFKKEKEKIEKELKQFIKDLP